MKPPKHYSDKLEEPREEHRDEIIRLLKYGPGVSLVPTSSGEGGLRPQTGCRAPGAHLALSLQKEHPRRVCLFPEVSAKYGLEGDETWWPGVKPQCQAKTDAEIFM